MFLSVLYTLLLSASCYGGNIIHLTAESLFFFMDLLFLLSFHHFLIIKLLLRCGDVEPNPGPKEKDCLSICHYNVNSLAAHNFAKLLTLEAFISVHHYDIICISESFLDSTFSPDDSALTLKGFKLIRADHPLNIKRGGI